MQESGHVNQGVIIYPGGVSPVARSLAAAFPFHSVTVTVTISSTITAGVATVGRWSALRGDAGRRGSPAEGRPDAFVLRPTGGVPRGHSEMDRGGLGGGPVAAGTTTAHAAVCQLRTSVPARGGSAVGVPEAGPAGLAPPDLRETGTSRVACAPDEEGDVQAAPWSSSFVTMGVATVPQARRKQQRVASTPIGVASGSRNGDSPLMPAGSWRRGAPLAAGLRRPTPV